MNYREVYLLDSAEKRWPKTEYVIAASNEEQFAVWERWNKGHTWEQCHGWLITLGEVHIGPHPHQLEKMPVTVSLSWVLFDGHLICFYDAESQVVDWRMVEKYVRSKCKRHTNATNFHICAHDLEQRPAHALPQEKKR